MKFVRAILRVLVGLIFGVVSGVALAPAFAAFSDSSGSNAWVIFVVVIGGALLGFFAPTLRRAFGRGFLLAGVSVLALPLSVMLLSGRVGSDMIAATDSGGQAATAAGAGIAGVMMTGVAGFIGFFFGAILIIVGLVLALGGRREVYVVQR
jgi:hypothetical protein